MKIDKTKFNYVVAKLDEQVLLNISDIILSTTVIRKYDPLEQRLMPRFQESEEAKFKLFLSGMNIWDLKPFSLFWEQIELLPQNNTAILSIWEINDLMGLAELGGNITENTLKILIVNSTPNLFRFIRQNEE